MELLFTAFCKVVFLVFFCEHLLSVVFVPNCEDLHILTNLATSILVFSNPSTDLNDCCFHFNPINYRDLNIGNCTLARLNRSHLNYTTSIEKNKVIHWKQSERLSLIVKNNFNYKILQNAVGVGRAEARPPSPYTAPPFFFSPKTLSSWGLGGRLSAQTCAQTAWCLKVDFGMDETVSNHLGPRRLPRPFFRTVKGAVMYNIDNWLEIFCCWAMNLQFM